MNLRAIGCNVSSAAVELREKLAFDAPKTTRALAELNADFSALYAPLGRPSIPPEKLLTSRWMAR